MENIIIIAVVALIAVVAVVTMVKGAGRKGCCGSAGDYRAKAKKLKNVIAVKTFRVEGMHCEKCSNRVAEVVNDIPGVAGTVDLKQGILTVSYEQEVADEVILERIRRVGYTVYSA